MFASPPLPADATTSAPVRFGVAHGIAECLARARPAERQVDHPCAVVDRPHDAGGDLGVRADAAGVQHLDREDARVPRGAGDADAVVRRRRRDAGDERSVADRRVVVRVGVSSDEVAPGKDLRRQVADGRHARVDDADDRPRRAVADVPRLRHANRRQVALGDCEVRIVRDFESVADVVRPRCGDRDLVPRASGSPRPGFVPSVRTLKSRVCGIRAPSESPRAARSWRRRSVWMPDRARTTICSAA